MADTSKSVVIRKFGNYDVLKVEDFPLPDLDGKVEVDVSFGGLNFCDIYKRLGFFERTLPFIMGSECCGVITKLGTEADDLKVGDHVICYDFEEGLYRQTLRISANKCFKLPAEIPLVDGAALFLNYVTAYFALFDLGCLKPGCNVLIKSCAGGLGCAATQLGKTVENVKIYGVLSKGKEQAAIENGVDFVYIYDANYIESLKADCPEGFDLILDNESGSSIRENNNLLRPLGKIVLLSANSMINNPYKISLFSKLKLFLGVIGFQLSSLMDKSTSICGLHMGNLLNENPKKVRQNLEAIFELYKNKKIKPTIDSVWPLEKIEEATKLLGERRNTGKVLLKMKESID